MYSILLNIRSIINLDNPRFDRKSGATLLFKLCQKQVSRQGKKTLLEVLIPRDMTVALDSIVRNLIFFTIIKKNNDK